MPSDHRSIAADPQPSGSPSLSGRILELAVGGDLASLERLLLEHHDRLLASIQRRLPASLRSTIAAEDVLQDTFVAAFRSIRQFRPQGDNGFYRWLCTLARHRLLDLVKANRTAKRGGGRHAGQLEGGDRSMAVLLEQIAAHAHTPSMSVAGREAAAAIHTALAGLPEDYRQALTMRYVEGRPVAQIAEAMKRTDRAVHMLCNRGLKTLAVALGRASQYFSPDA